MMQNWRKPRPNRAQEDARYFGNKLPAREHWRLYEWLRPRAVYLDIETNSWGQMVSTFGCLDRSSGYRVGLEQAILGC